MTRFPGLRSAPSGLRLLDGLATRSVTPAKAGVSCAGANFTGLGDASLRWHDVFWAWLKLIRARNIRIHGPHLSQLLAK
jgi:hypothetical protein